VTRGAAERRLPLAPAPFVGDLPPARTAPEALYRETLPVDPLGDDGAITDLEPVPAPGEMPVLRAPQPPPEPPPSTPEPERTPPAAPEAGARRYTVQPGDTLSEIASRELGTVRRMGEILALNPDLDPDRVVVGRVLDLPGTADAARGPSSPDPRGVRPEPSGAAPAARRYTVREGDTLTGIASRELGGVGRMDEILDLNRGLDPDRVLVGQVLLLPAPAPGAAVPAVARPRGPAVPTRRYTVSEGDTLLRIAARELGSSGRLEEIVVLNRDLDPDHLQVGQVLQLPADEAPSASRVAAAPRRSKVR
jgi:nucleoid-associated protein YgaU